MSDTLKGQCSPFPLHSVHENAYFIAAVVVVVVVVIQKQSPDCCNY
jgi:hypothetical protein